MSINLSQAERRTLCPVGESLEIEIDNLERARKDFDPSASAGGFFLRAKRALIEVALPGQRANCFFCY